MTMHLPESQLDQTTNQNKVANVTQKSLDLLFPDQGLEFSALNLR